MFSRALIALALVAAAAFPPALAGLPPSTKKFVYRAEGKKLADVLQDFAASQDMPIVVDAGVEGNVNGNFKTSPEEFLNAMTRTYGVIWYHDGTTLFVYPSRAMQSKVFRMRGYDRQQVRQMLASLGLGDPRFPLRFDESRQTLLAYGPPRHIELVSTVLAQLERDGRDRVGKAIRVVPLRYASAGDRVFGNTKVPGLASTLNRLFSAGSGGAAGADDSATPRRPISIASPEKLKSAQANYGMKPPAAGGAGQRDDETIANRLASAEPADPLDAERPYFQADEATNSLIVRGLPDRMKEYEALIGQLDAPQDLVEIEASIIDVSSDEFDSLGVDWTFSRDGVTRFSVSPGTPANSPGGSPLETLSGTNITTVLGNAGQQLLAKVRALEGSGKAHIVARPKVLGAVNRMATMVDKRVASVRVAGNLDANLFNVEVGTTLQVTPQIVAYADHREVRLSLSVRDGNFESTSVDQVPIVKQTEISTEATIREGESLLIGGISVESDGKSRTGVPGLSRIPLLGAAFRHDEGHAFRTERLFLLTPKILTVGAARASAALAASAPASLPSAPCAAKALGLITSCSNVTAP